MLKLRFAVPVPKYGGRYLQILSGKDLYKQTIVVSARSHDDTFPAGSPNIFVDYPLGQMLVGINCGQTGICDYGKLS